MYVSGRGTEGYGTIFPAIIEWKRKGNNLDDVYMIGKNGVHSHQAFEKVKSLQKISGVNINIEAYPNKDQIDPEAYVKILKAIEQPACAIVAVPDHLHYEVTKNCLESGFHTLVMKPLTPTTKEANELIKIADEKNKVQILIVWVD